MRIEQISAAIPQPINTGISCTAVAAGFASFLGYLPSVAAALSVAWLLFQFWVAWKTKPWRRK